MTRHYKCICEQGTHRTITRYFIIPVVIDIFAAAGDTENQYYLTLYVLTITHLQNNCRTFSQLSKYEYDHAGLNSGYASFQAIK